VIEAKLFLCSDSVALDGRHNSISAFHILEQLMAPAFPVAVPRISVIALLTREAEDPNTAEFQLQVHLGNQQLFAGPVAITFLQQLSSRSIIDMHGLVVPAPGTLRFLLRNGEATMGAWTISMLQAGQPSIQLHFPVSPPAAPDAVGRISGAAQ
jgi:hypothetical protein